MKLYYHKTDGGAEYYCTDYHVCPNGEKDGDIRTAVLRTDGGELEIFMKNLDDQDIRLVIK